MMDGFEKDWSDDSVRSDTSDEIFDDYDADPEYKPKHIKTPDSKFKTWVPVTSNVHSRLDDVSESSGSAGTSIKMTLKKTRSSRNSSSKESIQSSKAVKSVSRAFKIVTSQEDEKDSDKIFSKDMYKQDKCLNECDDHSRQDDIPETSGFAGTSNKKTLKKIRSSRSISSRKSSKAVKSVSRAFKIVTSQEDKKDSDKIFSEDMDESENDSEKKPQTRVSDGNIVDIEVSLDESEKSFSKRPRPVVPVKEESKYKTIPLSTVVDSTTDNIPQNSSLTKKEEYKLKIKSLKNYPLKKNNDEKTVFKDENYSVPTLKTQNGVVVKKPVKENKFKIKVCSSDELSSPYKSNLINVTPGHGQSNFSSQNGVQFSPPPFMSCDVCEIQFNSSVLLNDHKVAMKHFKCSFKDCEHLFFSSQQECLDHQNLIHSIISSPVQQLAHQVQSLPAESSDQLLQSSVPLPPDNLVPLSDIPNMYIQTLQMPNQPVPLIRPMQPIIRLNMPHMMSARGHNVQKRSRGRRVSMNSTRGRGTSMKRPASLPLTGSSTLKRTPTDRYYLNNLNKTTTPIATCLSQSVTEPVSLAGHQALPNSSIPQDVVNLFSKRELTINTVETIGNSSVTLPAKISLNSAVTIIPTSSHKIPNTVPLKVANQTTSYKVSNAPRQNVDLVHLTGLESMLWRCEICLKTYSSIESLYEHVFNLHKSRTFSFKCNLCKLSYPYAGMLRQHKLENHSQEMSSSNPFVIPILDITESSTVTKLQAMGVTNYVPVAQLDSQGSQYGVPIMNISRPGSVDGLKYTNFFNFGSIRKLNT